MTPKPDFSIIDTDIVVTKNLSKILVNEIVASDGKLASLDRLYALAMSISERVEKIEVEAHKIKLETECVDKL
jgi:hypothetical protein